MFEFATSISGVLMLIVILYVFRKPVRTITEEAPEAIEHVFMSAIKASRQLDSTVSINCAESEVDNQARMKVLLQRVVEEDLPNVQDAYNRIMGIKPNK